MAASKERSFLAMAWADSARTPWWSWTWPGLGLLILVAHFAYGLAGVLTAAEAFALIATVFSAVYHAEVVALRVGEPFGTLVLALAVTTIEVALIVSIMIAGGTETASLARDTLFAAVMIVCNGIIGLCLLAGGLRHYEQEFQLRGANAALSVLIALTTLILILPNVTTTIAGPTFSRSQLSFAAVVSLILYGSFVFVQTLRHRDYFLPVGVNEDEAHVPPPPNKVALASAGLLLGSLVVVVALAEVLTPAVEHGIEAVGAPKSVVGVIIAGLVVLPEGLAAYRAAIANRLQTSVNLALGSAWQALD
jgi:Ca2+:H+ antiporter